MENLTTEEKIDYIFKTLHKQEKRELHKIIWKWLFRLFIVAYIVYFYMFWFDILINSINDKIKDSINVDMNIDKDSIIEALKSKTNLNY